MVSPIGTTSTSTFLEDFRTDEATTSLIREAIGETRELVRIELALAREDVKGELAAAKRGAIALAAALAASLVGLAVSFVAIALAFPVAWLAAVLIGGGLFALAVCLGVVGRRMLPTTLLEKTKGRVRTDLKDLRGRIV